MNLTCLREKTPSQRRSRFGCRNCKLRKLKCDEFKPRCKRCSSFGVLCNFEPNVHDLQPLTAERGRPLVVRRQAIPRSPLTNLVWTSDASSSYQLNTKCQDFVTRYLGRSLTAPNDPKMAQVNRKLLELAFSVSLSTIILAHRKLRDWKLELIHNSQYPFLMHASIGVALTYDRHLNGSSDKWRTPEECYHWSQSTILLNKRLRKPIAAQDRDPIWGTAAALAILSFSSPGANTPGEAWPMRSGSSSELDWLRMSRAKMSLWHMVNPLRPDSIFHVMAATYADMYAPLPERGTDGIQEDLAAVCNLQDSSTAESNPYFHAAHAVSRMLDVPDDEVTTGQTQIFMRIMQSHFEDLLRQRDPVALLLLYLWYRKTSRSIWWIELRTKVESPSICLYLRLYHHENAAIQAFLPGGTLTDEWD